MDWDSLEPRQKDRQVHEKVFGQPSMCYGSIEPDGHLMRCQTCYEYYGEQWPHDFATGKSLPHVAASVPHYSTQTPDAWRILTHFVLLKNVETREAAWYYHRLEHDICVLMAEWFRLSPVEFCDLLCRIAVNVYSKDIDLEHPNVAQVLATPLHDEIEETIGDYLCALLERLWEEEEGFSPRRPFGESAWQVPVYEALIRAGYVKGVLGGPGNAVIECDYMAADNLIGRCIREVFEGTHDQS